MSQLVYHQLAITMHDASRLAHNTQQKNPHASMPSMTKFKRPRLHRSLAVK